MVTLTNVILFIILLLIIICLVFTEKLMRPLQCESEDIPRFSVAVEFKQIQTQTDINNLHDCNTNSLRKCILGDVNSLMGCKEMAVTCNRFEDDIYLHDNGKISIIPKNENSDEGYALSIRAIADACNPFHGDTALISAGLESRDYVLGCLCKNPGYVGSEHVLDSCDTPYICNGKIDNINQPLENINCVCSATEIASRYDDGLPVCKPMTVLEANRKFVDWSHLVPWTSDRLIDKNVFNATIRSNFNTRVLLNPCESSLTDMTIPIQGAYYNELFKTCAYKDYGLPVRTGTLEPYEDQVVSETIDAALPSNRHKYLRIIDNVGGERKLVNVRTAVNFDLFYSGGPSDQEHEANFTLPKNLGIGLNAQFMISTANQVLGGRCKGSWPYYQCTIDEYFSHSVFGIPKPGNREPPGTFLWDTEAWENAEKMVSCGMVAAESGLTLNNEYLDINKESVKYYGIKLCHKTEVGCYNGILAFKNNEDYKLHQNILT